MKCLLFTLLFIPFVSFSQLPDGSIAPDWNYIDLNGNDHHLYSYLDSGYTVVIDVCATWCPPCYNYHLGAALDSLWENYGPDGTNEMRIFHIEADPSTTIADLYGTGSNTQGDYVTGTFYPIINADNFIIPYQITYYPTVYMICPERTITEVGQVPFADVYAAKSTECYVPSIGESFRIANVLGDLTYCDTENSNLSVLITNFEGSPLTNAQIEVIYNQNVISATNWNGTLETNATTEIQLNSFPVDNIMNVELRLTDVNNPGYADTLEKILTHVPIAPHSFDLKFYTDYWPSDNSWEIRNSNGDIVAFYQFDAQAGGGPDALTERIFSVTVPEPDDCYELIIRDFYGEGFDDLNGLNPFGYFGVQLETNGVVFADFTQPGDWNFGDSLVVKAFEINPFSGINENALTQPVIYPNPSQGLVTISSSKNGGVLTVLNATGAKVLSTQLTGQETVLDLSDQPQGLYLIQINTDKDQTMTKLNLY